MIEVGETKINLEGVEVIAFLVELVGDVVAGALLPVNPIVRILPRRVVLRLVSSSPPIWWMRP